jgi:hypothetical protein
MPETIVVLTDLVKPLISLNRLTNRQKLSFTMRVFAARGMLGLCP